MRAVWLPGAGGFKAERVPNDLVTVLDCSSLPLDGAAGGAPKKGAFLGRLISAVRLLRLMAADVTNAGKSHVLAAWEVPRQSF